jgi:hypothetical protein
MRNLIIVILIGLAITSGCSVSASVGKYGVGMSAHPMN